MSRIILGEVQRPKARDKRGKTANLFSGVAGEERCAVFFLQKELKKLKPIRYGAPAAKVLYGFNYWS